MATFNLKTGVNLLYLYLVMQENNTKIFSINERILQLLEYLDITRYKFSHETGISETVLLNIYKCKNKPSFDVIEKILNHYPTINAEWFLTGKGEMLKRTDNTQHKTKSNG